MNTVVQVVAKKGFWLFLCVWAAWAGPVLTFNPDIISVAKGQAVVSNTPTVQNGYTATGFTVSPSLPTGIYLDPTNGTLYGAPQVKGSQANYVVTMAYSGGSVKDTVSITVLAIAPQTLNYSVTTVMVKRGLSISRLSPVVTPFNLTTSNSDSIDAFTVTPSLPAGLVLNAKSGDVTGTATTGHIDLTAYIFSATNTGGVARDTINIQVDTVVTAPSGLSYSNPVISINQGVSISPNSPTYSGSPADSFAILPALPSGFSMNRLTGVITGTAGAVQSAIVYTVFVYNNGGTGGTVTFTSTNVSIAVLTTRDTVPPFNRSKFLNLTGIGTGTPKILYAWETPEAWWSTDADSVIICYSVFPLLQGYQTQVAKTTVKRTPVVKVASFNFKCDSVTTGIAANTKYYFSIQVRDIEGNFSTPVLDSVQVSDVLLYNAAKVHAQYLDPTHLILRIFNYTSMPDIYTTKVDSIGIWYKAGTMPSIYPQRSQPHRMYSLTKLRTRAVPYVDTIVVPATTDPIYCLAASAVWVNSSVGIDSVMACGFGNQTKVAMYTVSVLPRRTVSALSVRGVFIGLNKISSTVYIKTALTQWVDKQIECTVYDARGNRVSGKSLILNDGSQTVWNTKGVAPGMYMIRLQTADAQVVSPVFIQ